MNEVEKNEQISEVPDHTPVPWQWANFVNKDGSPITSKEQIKAILCESVDKSEGLYLAGVIATDEKGEATVCYTGNGPKSHKNAQFIVGLANSYAALRECLKKKDAMITRLLDHDAFPNHPDTPFPTEEEVKAALSSPGEGGGV